MVPLDLYIILIYHIICFFLLTKICLLSLEKCKMVIIFMKNTNQIMAGWYSKCQAWKTYMKGLDMKIFDCAIPARYRQEPLSLTCFTFMPAWISNIFVIYCGVKSITYPFPYLNHINKRGPMYHSLGDQKPSSNPFVNMLRVHTYHATVLIILCIIYVNKGSQKIHLNSVWSPRITSPSSNTLKVSTDDNIGIWPGQVFSDEFQHLEVKNYWTTIGCALL